uniref:Regulator of G-protein signaling 1 n=1 Tax=Stegastes partitus TaxID=144197 RepID=A0A3B4ZRB3_9TELE
TTGVCTNNPRYKKTLNLDKRAGCSRREKRTSSRVLIFFMPVPFLKNKSLNLVPGQIAFREFLKSEYSEENILFWLACEEYKKIKTAPEMISSANRIYSEFVDSEAPRQINIDCGTRENITKNISQPTLTSFDTAQKLIYSLMARDCYPRFLKSDIYQGLLRRNDSR